jgi:hypothetical protein
LENGNKNIIELFTKLTPDREALPKGKAQYSFLMKAVPFVSKETYFSVLKVADMN